MNDMPDRAKVTSEWHRAWSHKWAASAPGGAAYSGLKKELNAFFCHLVAVADWDTGENTRPPAYETLAVRTGCAAQRISLLYEAAEALGIVVLHRTPAGRVKGYRLQFPWAGELKWPAALAVIQSDRRTKRRADTKTQSAAALSQSETPAADSVSEPSEANPVRGCTSEEAPEGETQSADSRNPVRGLPKPSPRRGGPSTDPLPQPTMADLSLPQQTPAREATEDEIPGVTEYGTALDEARRRQMTRQERLLGRLRVRPDAELRERVLADAWGDLHERERVRVSELCDRIAQKHARGLQLTPEEASWWPVIRVRSQRAYGSQTQHQRGTVGA